MFFSCRDTKIKTTTDISLIVLKENPLEKGGVEYFEPNTNVNRFAKRAAILYSRTGSLDLYLVYSRSCCSSALFFLVIHAPTGKNVPVDNWYKQA